MQKSQAPNGLSRRGARVQREQAIERGTTQDTTVTYTATTGRYSVDHRPFRTVRGLGVQEQCGVLRGIVTARGSSSLPCIS